MRVCAGVVQVLVDAIDQSVTDGMLHVLGFFVNLIPCQVKRLRKKQFDQSMAAQHAHRDRTSFSRQSHTLVRSILRMARFGERLHHAGDSAG